MPKSGGNYGAQVREEVHAFLDPSDPLATKLFKTLRAKGLKPGNDVTKSLYELAKLVEEMQPPQPDFDAIMKSAMQALADEISPILKGLRDRIEELEKR